MFGVGAGVVAINSNQLEVLVVGVGVGVQGGVVGAGVEYRFGGNLSGVGIIDGVVLVSELGC